MLKFIVGMYIADIITCDLVLMLSSCWFNLHPTQTLPLI